LGTPTPTVTLGVYARADHAGSARDALEASYAGMAATSHIAT
jgi:hypothetical protein